MNKNSSLLPVVGGAKGDFGPRIWKPRNMNVLTKFLKSARSLRIHKMTLLQSNFSSENSKREINDCFDASCDIFDGNSTYKILLTGFKT